MAAPRLRGIFTAVILVQFLSHAFSLPRATRRQEFIREVLEGRVQKVATDPPQATTTPEPPQGTTTPPGPPDNVAFFVGRNESLSDIMRPVQWHFEEINHGEHFDFETGIFTSPNSTTNFVFVNAGLLPSEGVRFDVRLNNMPYNGLQRLNTLHNGRDTMSRAFIMNLDQGDELHTENQVFSTLYSDELLSTSFGAFQLDRNMNTTSAFSVWRNTGWSTIGRISFDQVEVNINNCYDTATDTFVAPKDGLYYFSYSVGTVAVTPVSVELQVNAGAQMVLQKDNLYTNGADTISRSTMLSLHEGDVVEVHLVNGLAHSDFSAQIRWSGFLYEPLDIPPVAWSVHRTESWHSESMDLDPIDYDDIKVSEGGAFNDSSNIVTIPVSGVYLINLNVAVDGELPMEMNTVVDDEVTYPTLYRNSTNHLDVDVIASTALIELSAGSTIRTVARQGSGLYSDANKHTSFTGFLLYRV